jgi:tetrapyrrole methylase family protein/MazG family protein
VSARPRITVVGLGPAGIDLLVPAARAELERVGVRYTRTARHPAVSELAGVGIELRPLDHHYESAADLDAAYAGIVEELLAAAVEHGEVVYAVPGSPSTAERTPAMLVERGAEVRLVPGLSFAELACGSVWIHSRARESSTAAGSRSALRARAARCSSPSATPGCRAPR